MDSLEGLERFACVRIGIIRIYILLLKLLLFEHPMNELRNCENTAA